MEKYDPKKSPLELSERVNVVGTRPFTPKVKRKSAAPGTRRADYLDFRTSRPSDVGKERRIMPAMYTSSRKTGRSGLGPPDRLESRVPYLPTTLMGRDLILIFASSRGPDSQPWPGAFAAGAKKPPAGAAWFNRWAENSLSDSDGLRKAARNGVAAEFFTRNPCKKGGAMDSAQTAGRRNAKNFARPFAKRTDGELPLRKSSRPARTSCRVWWGIFRTEDCRRPLGDWEKKTRNAGWETYAVRMVLAYSSIRAGQPHRGTCASMGISLEGTFTRCALARRDRRGAQVASTS